MRLLKSEGPARLARFGVFELDTQVSELRRRGLKVHLPDQAARVLTLLLVRKGLIVTIEDLRKELWQDALYLDYSHAIHNAVNRVRRALQDSADRPLFVETVPRRGYRFLAPVEWFSVEEPPRRTEPSSNRRTLLAYAGGMAGVAACATVGWRVFGSAGESGCTHPGRIGDKQVTLLRAFRGSVLSVCHRPDSGAEWVVWRSADSGARPQVVAYAGRAHVEHLEVLAGGVAAVFYEPGWNPWWEIRLCPDGASLRGGDGSRLLYRRNTRVAQIVPYLDGMLTVCRGAADAVYFSPDGSDAGGGGKTRRVYEGSARVDAIQPFNGGVLTALSDAMTGEPRGVFLSPDGEHLGGGGRTENVYSGPARVRRFAVTPRGVLTAFGGSSGRMSRVFLSPDGRSLGGGGRTRLVYGGWGEVEAMVPYRDGVVTAFRAPGDGEALGVFYSPDCDHLAGGESTVALVEGGARVSAMAVAGNQVVAAFENRSNGELAGRYVQIGGAGV